MFYRAVHIKNFLAFYMAGSSMRLVSLKLRVQPPIGARTARYNENLQTMTTLGPEISSACKTLL